jgi:hypothetical protein
LPLEWVDGERIGNRYNQLLRIDWIVVSECRCPLGEGG